MSDNLITNLNLNNQDEMNTTFLSDSSKGLENIYSSTASVQDANFYKDIVLSQSENWYHKDLSDMYDNLMRSAINQNSANMDSTLLVD